MENKITSAKLNDGGAIQLLGFGTAEFGSSTDDSVKEAIVHAIRLGYRHFDSAACYGSEPPLGAAIEEALSLGLIKSRDELFITSKLWCTDAHPEFVLPALQSSLKNLKMKYLDLYLIHWPVSLKTRVIEFPIKSGDIVSMDFKSIWEEMEKCKEMGLAKSIGVSNFSCKKLEDLLATAKIFPAVNQVELNPVWQQKKLREFCNKHGIHISAFSPLGAAGTAWGSNLVMGSEVLQEVATSHGKSVAKVALRWAYEQGVSVIVKSFNKERMEQNMDIFDWKLTPDDLDKISKLPQRRVNTGQEFISDEGPYKSLEQFWDGEI